MPRYYILNITALLMLISINSLAINNYISDILPQVITNLEKNTDDLITQKRTIYTTKQILNELVKKQEISTKQARYIKNTLDTIFENNVKESSNYQRAIYSIQRPFQFVYNKITNPNANYKKRLAWAATATAGAAITAYTLYQGGKRIYYAIPAWQIKQLSITTSEILTN